MHCSNVFLLWRLKIEKYKKWLFQLDVKKKNTAEVTLIRPGLVLFGDKKKEKKKAFYTNNKNTTKTGENLEGIFYVHN